MPDRPLKLHDLRRILRSFDVSEDPSRGKGSHTMFFKRLPDRLASLPIPCHHGEISAIYVRRIRAVFRLTQKDGITDRDFYGR